MPDSNPFTVTQTYPDDSECKWTITEVHKNLVELRSSCCQYAFNWRPDGVNTCWEMFVGDYYRDGSMMGMCGDCNGDNVDDFR